MTTNRAALRPQILPVRRPQAQPFLKWVGGKRALLPQLDGLFPRRYDRYFEPFVGGGAVFFHLAPERAFLSDGNADLVNAFTVVRDELPALLESLGAHENDEAYYYAMRARRPADLDPVARASRLIYLNRTCFNGLYRVNAKGDFNVPFGRYKNPTICNTQGLTAASAALQGVELSHQPYQAILEAARAGDFVYLDPPYHPLTETANFTSYTHPAFGVKDQEALASLFQELTLRGCKVMMSNSNTPLIRALYADYVIDEVMAPRLVNRDASKRGPIRELVVRNYR